jgi:hypothetical protein
LKVPTPLTVWGPRFDFRAAADAECLPADVNSALQISRIFPENSAPPNRLAGRIKID